MLGGGPKGRINPPICTGPKGPMQINAQFEAPVPIALSLVATVHQELARSRLHGPTSTLQFSREGDDALFRATEIERFLERDEPGRTTDRAFKIGQR